MKAAVPQPRVLLAGASTRAAADSAARAGFAVTALDAYGDRDQHPTVRALSTRRDFGVPFTPATAARLSRTLVVDAAAYLSSFENHPAAIASLARGRALWGNPPQVIRAVRDPFAVAAALSARGVAVPRCARTPESSTPWLLKPRRSGGGHGVRPWESGMRVTRASYLQERIDGVPGSIVFVAAAGRMVPLGISLQIAGDTAFGASGYRYCGSIMGPAPLLFGTADVLRSATLVAAAVAGEFQLAGLNGVDFIARAAEALPIEINPRWSSSMELVERLTGESMFAAHAAACTGGILPAVGATPNRVAGKAIVYARTPAVVGDTRAWLDDPDVRDIPHSRERIDRGQPICTVFADADSVATCRMMLAGRAARIYADVERWQREAA